MQTRRGSLVEAWVNTTIGYVINLGVQLVVYPAFGAVFTFWQNIQIGLIFMVVSVARTYAIRRWFNLYIHRSVMALLHEKEIDRRRSS